MVKLPRPDWPAWAIFAIAVLALFAALTADGQTCPPPGLDSACAAEHPLPCPYPVARVTAAHQAAIIAKGGPWILAPGILAPYPGMVRGYQTAEDWRRAAWALPSDVYRWPYCRVGQPCGLSVENAAWAVAKTLKPNSDIDSCFGHTGNHGVAAESFVWLYGAKPTFGQWLELECHGDRGGWWAADGRLHKALLCSQGGTPPPPPPLPPPPPPPPPPPEPPGSPACVPYAGSSCEARCAQVGKDRAWCLDSERENGARLLFGLCSGVCRLGEPEPPPPPSPPEPPPPSPECPPTAFERACRSLGISAERCRTLARWISACDPTCDPKCFVPGIPSTGQTATEVVP